MRTSTLSLTGAVIVKLVILASAQTPIDATNVGSAESMGSNRDRIAKAGSPIESRAPDDSVRRVALFGRDAQFTKQSRKMTDAVTIDANGRRFTVTLRDAAEIRDTLIRYLEKAPRPDHRSLAPTLAGADPVITPQGYIRIGIWRLGVRADRLALTCHLYNTDAASIGCLAFLDRIKDRWEVVEVTDDIMRFDPQPSQG
jgi:hypothetical protein